MEFNLHSKDNQTRARRGEILLAYGVVQTPVFMPVGTVGSVKGVSNEELEALGAKIILGNTYHLHLRPTSEYVVGNFGSLHNFTGWHKPILTDSGGFQVFSLGLRAEAKDGAGPRLVKISEEGVQFQSHIDGSSHMFSPERVIDIQRNLGSDIMMMLDVCPDGNADAAAIRKAVDQTHRWAKRAKAYWDRVKGEREQALFGIVQGGPDKDMRRESAEYIANLHFDGIAIGGVANGGESKEKMHQAVAYAMPYISEDKPRYLMGVGEPVDMIRAVAQGVDMFDCVLPTRLGRHGVAWIGDEKTGFTSLDLTKSDMRHDKGPIETGCGCNACAGGYARAYIYHLLKEKEILGVRLVTVHNLYMVLRLFDRMRASLEAGTFAQDFQKPLRGLSEVF